MSDPAQTPRTVTELEWQSMLGRVGALELLTAQSWVGLLRLVKDEDREEFIQDALIGLEQRFERFDPIAARAALESADGITSSALVTVRQNAD